MMFFSKSLGRKLVGFVILASVFLCGLGYFVWTRRDDVFYLVSYLFLLLVIGALVAKYYFDVVSPLKPIVAQMQFLIAGKPFKKLYTNRIDEVGVLAYFFNQVTKGLGQAGEEIRDRNRIVGELEIAAQLQRDILPLKSPVIPGLQLVAKNKPATEIGGDSFNFITSGDKTYIYIGDVTGHGVAAGLIMTMVSSLLNIFANVYKSPYEIVVNVNKYIKTQVKRAMFMTMVLLCWDHTKKELVYVGAGHEHILLYRRATGVCEAILSGGVALGMVPDNSKLVVEKKIDLDDGDFVILYSDGITEAKNAAGEMYGLERLRTQVAEFASQYSAEGVNYHVAKDVATFMSGTQQNDDMTLIVMQRTDNSASTNVASDLSTNWQS